MSTLLGGRMIWRTTSAYLYLIILAVMAQGWAHGRQQQAPACWLDGAQKDLMKIVTYHFGFISGNPKE